jgi:glycosyltransferase involved in cell wall biosynthesis
LAIEGGAEVVVMMDADGQDDPDELPKLVARLEAGADLVTGARLMRQDRFVEAGTPRRSTTG